MGYLRRGGLPDGTICPNPLSVNIAEYPKMHLATPFVGLLKAGDVLYLPRNTFHYVLSLQPSVTFIYNFMSKFNEIDETVLLFAFLPLILTAAIMCFLGIVILPNEVFHDHDTLRFTALWLESSSHNNDGKTD